MTAVRYGKIRVRMAVFLCRLNNGKAMARNTFRRQNGEMREVAYVELQDGKPLVAEMCFNQAGRPFIPARETHHWDIDDQEFVQAITETYQGVDDPRLPEDVKSLPVGRREDFVKTFNLYVYWYWKDEDKGYDENLPLHVNAVNYATKMAYSAIEKDEDSKESAPAPDDSGKVQESTPAQVSEQPIHEDGIGFINASAFGEADSGGYNVPLQIIEGGWSLNGTYYTKEALSDIARLVSQKCCGYFNHGDHQRNPMEWNLVVEEGWVDGNTVQGKAHVFQYPDGEALKERIDYVVENKALHLFGVSIDGFARIEEGTIDGRKGKIVRSVVAMHSVDVVMIPAANGRFGKTIASASKEDLRKNLQEDAKIMDLETLKKEHPELAEALREEGRVEVRNGDLKTTQESLATTNTELETLRTENVELKAKVEQNDLEKAQEAFAEKVKTRVGTELEKTPHLITEQFVNDLIGLGESNWEKIESLIGERKALNVGGPKDMGKPPENTTESKADEKSKEERLANFKEGINRRKYGA